MKAHRAEFPLAAMCRVLGLSSSGYYDWLKRPPSARAQRDAELEARIGSIWTGSGETYGRPRIHAALRAEGERVGQKPVGRLMRGLGIEGATRRRFKTATTKMDTQASPAPDLVNRDFSASGPDQLWVADITYAPTWAGWLYLAVVLDVWSRRVVGWAMATHMRTELVEAALAMALARRRPEGRVVHHSDRGSQYTSLAFGERCRESGIAQSMGSAGNAYDNAMCESFLRDAGVRADLAALVPYGVRGPARGLRLYRGLPQHAPAPLGPRLRVAGQLREEPCGLRRTAGAHPEPLSRV